MVRDQSVPDGSNPATKCMSSSKSVAIMSYKRKDDSGGGVERGRDAVRLSLLRLLRRPWFVFNQLDRLPINQPCRSCLPAGRHPSHAVGRTSASALASLNK